MKKVGLSVLVLSCAFVFFSCKKQGIDNQTLKYFEESEKFEASKKFTNKDELFSYLAARRLQSLERKKKKIISPLMSINSSPSDYVEGLDADFFYSGSSEDNMDIGGNANTTEIWGAVDTADLRYGKITSIGVLTGDYVERGITVVTQFAVNAAVKKGGDYDTPLKVVFEPNTAYSLNGEFALIGASVGDIMNVNTVTNIMPSELAESTVQQTAEERRTAIIDSEDELRIELEPLSEFPVGMLLGQGRKISKSQNTYTFYNLNWSVYLYSLYNRYGYSITGKMGIGSECENCTITGIHMN